MAAKFYTLDEAAAALKLPGKFLVDLDKRGVLRADPKKGVSESALKSFRREVRYSIPEALRIIEHNMPAGVSAPSLRRLRALANSGRFGVNLGGRWMVTHAQALEYAESDRQAGAAGHGDGSAAKQFEGKQVTAREREVLELSKAGKSRAEIAEALGCKPATITTHLWRLRVKGALE